MLASRSQELRFGAIKLAKYKVAAKVITPEALEAKPSEFTVFQLEPKDLPTLDKMHKIAEKAGWVSMRAGYDYKKDVHNYIILKMIETTQKLLLFVQNVKVQPPFRVYLAVSDRQPCGMAMVSMPKITQDFRTVFSSRDKPDETELDWFATWPLASGQKVPGVGKVLLAHVIEFARERGFNRLFVKAANQAQSDCLGFYKAMGFKETGPHRKATTLSTPRDLGLVLGQDPIYPNPAWIIPMSMPLAAAAKRGARWQKDAQQVILSQRSVALDKQLDL